MKQNIKLFIGDNASGKTRNLSDILVKYRDNHAIVVTNMYNYKDYYATDSNKIEAIKQSCNETFDRVFNKDFEIKTPYDSYVMQLMLLVISEGDILVLDELDANLISQDVVNVSAAISSVRHLWKGVYVTGYSMELLRLFTDIDDEYREKYNPNVYLVDKDCKIYRLDEDTLYESFDTIRG